jgi:hypothetical protein
MYLIQRVTDPLQVRVTAMQHPPFGPGFAQSEVDAAAAMEIWGTEIKDPGPDYCIFILYGKDHTKLASKRVDGY